MIVIKSPQEIPALQASGAAPDLVELAERRLREITAAYAECGATFDPEEHGPIAVLEAGDDVRNLSEIGLNPDDRGLVGALKEVVTRHPVAYEAIVLYSNDYGVAFLCPDEPWLDPELRAVLEAEMAEAHPTPLGTPTELSPF